MATRSAVTQREIARALGLTQMTVSRALNGSDLLAPDTRARILAKADELGYRSNGLAKRVQERRYRGMALLGSEARPGYNIGEESFHRAVGTTLAAHRWHLTQGWLPAEGLGDAQVVHSLLDRMLADAVLIHDVGEQSPQAEALLLHHHIPRVWVNSGREWDGVDFADADGAMAGVRHLHGQGYRRIGLAIPHAPTGDDHISLRERARGFGEACGALGLPATILHPPGRLPLGEHLVHLRQRLAGPDRPDAVLCYSPEFIVLLRIIAAERGWRIGPDLGVVTFGPAARTTLDLPYTALDQDYASLGREAVEMAWRLLDSGERQRQVLVPVALVRPGSTTTR